MRTARTIFITGTDTSVGKTALTALLLAHAQAQGVNVRALKPFASGDGGDEALLGSLQKSSLRINFFHYQLNSIIRIGGSHKLSFTCVGNFL